MMTLPTVLSLYSIWKFLADSCVTLPPKSSWYTWLAAFHIGLLLRSTSFFLDRLPPPLAFTGGGAVASSDDSRDLLLAGNSNRLRRLGVLKSRFLGRNGLRKSGVEDGDGADAAWCFGAAGGVSRHDGAAAVAAQFLFASEGDGIGRVGREHTTAFLSPSSSAVHPSCFASLPSPD